MLYVELEESQVTDMGVLGFTAAAVKDVDASKAIEEDKLLAYHIKDTEKGYGYRYIITVSRNVNLVSEALAPGETVIMVTTLSYLVGSVPISLLREDGIELPSRNSRQS